MRAETKKRLLAMLEADLKKVKEKLEPKHQKPMQEIASEMGEISNKLRTMEYSKAWDKLNFRYKTLDLDFQKLLKQAEKFNSNISKNMNEQWRLEEDIQELKMILTYARPDLTTKH